MKRVMKIAKRFQRGSPNLGVKENGRGMATLCSTMIISTSSILEKVDIIANLCE
jgi:hypothetical protein